MVRQECRSAWGHGVHTSINDRSRRWGSSPPSCRTGGGGARNRSSPVALEQPRVRAENTRPMMARSSGVSEDDATRSSEDHDAVCTFRSGESAQDGAPAAPLPSGNLRNAARPFPLD